MSSDEHARAVFADEVDGNVYSRYANPNTDEFVHKLCALEGGEDGIATASGMAAVFTALASRLSTCDHVLESRGMLVEMPSNPRLELVDRAWLGALGCARGILPVHDNCLATPYLQRPLEWGASLVVHSATKFIDGQGSTLGGAIVRDKALVADARYFARHTGPALSPFNAWMLCKSLETLAVRMDRHCANALALATHFEGHAEPESVRYPFLASHPQHELAKRQMRAGPGIVALVLRGGGERCARFLDGLRLCSHSPNLGDTRTIVTHPTSTTHSKLTEQERQKVGIVSGLVRVSVGLENVGDVIADLEQALVGA